MTVATAGSIRTEIRDRTTNPMKHQTFLRHGPNSTWLAKCECGWWTTARNEFEALTVATRHHPTRPERTTPR